ncbi:hypothetical protein E4U52_002138 [Claviceps spartinae]|nr:hypothetical protein E4U52_002138 [Claviceps spartinae]
MASQFPMAQPLYRPANLTVDTHRVPQDYLEDDGESCMLDDAVDSGLGLSPPIANSRRQSFAMGSVLFSPKSEDWPSIDMRSVPSNQFADLNGRNNGNSHHPLMALNTAHSQIFPSQGNPWDLATGSACAQFNQMQDSSFNAGQTMFQRPLPSSFDNLGAIFPAMNSADPSIQRSPQKGWESPNQPIRKKRKTCSPVFPARDGLRKGDGIRKKNARADIPADRNLNTIDTLIAQSVNEQETKVLKQQKRLLRNRQAALDSRQRKKQHTDHLEEENKELRSVNTGLEQELASLKSQVEMLAQEKTNLMSCVDRVTMEKEDAIRASTIETAELRKKVAVLTNHVQRLENRGIRNNASGVSNHHFSAGNYNGMNGMPGSWDNTSYTSDCSPSQQHQVRPQMSDMRPPKIEEPALPSETEKGSTSQGGLLFMLFLVGALVVSSRTMPTIPRVSEDVRAASATLLATVFEDAGISCLPEGIRSMPPQPSGSAWSRSAGAGAGADMNNADMDNAAAPSMLDDLGHALTRPTQEQMRQHIFSMSATQYDGVGNQNFLSEGLDTSQQSRKNLADALAAVRAASQHDQESAADVYTRSLLWEQIPLEVVRNFARLVAECNHGILGGIAVQ